MQRRVFIRSVASFFVAARAAWAQQRLNDPTLPPPAPVPWTLGLNSQTPIPVTELADQVAAASPKFFTPLQMRTLTRLCDALLPPLNGKPGALEAETPAFLDFLIGSSPEEQRKVYTGGLDWLEETAQSKYQVEFAKLSDTQTHEVIQPWLRSWMSDHPPTEAHADFINIAHDDIRHATVNSKAWDDVPSVCAEPKTEEAIYWSPIEPDVFGENPAYDRTPPHVQALPKGGQKFPVYPR